MPASTNPANEPPLTVEALRQKATDVAARVLEDFPDDPGCHALAGRVDFLHGNTVEAEKYWKRCLELDPRRADAYSAMGLAAVRKGDFEKAVVACRRALEIDPSRSDVSIRLGHSLMELGRTEELIVAMERAVRTSPRSRESHFFLGQGYMQSKEFGKAQECFRRAVGIRPIHIQSYYGLATASIRLGQREEAKQYLEKFRQLMAAELEALKARNRHASTLSGVATERVTTANACNGAAVIYRNHGNLQQAERLWRTGATIDPNNTACRAELMALYERGRRHADALAFCERLTQLQPDSAVNYFYLGNVHARRGRYGAAGQAYRKFVQLAPDRPDGYRALANLYLAIGRNLPEATKFASKAVELKPNPQNYFLLAQAYTKNRDRAAALEALQRAMEMDPDNVQYRQLNDLLRKEK